MQFGLQNLCSCAHFTACEFCLIVILILGQDKYHKVGFLERDLLFTRQIPLFVSKQVGTFIKRKMSARNSLNLRCQSTGSKY